MGKKRQAITDFSVDPLRYVSGVEAERARRSLDVYMRTFSGRYFEVFAADSHPNQFTGADVLAAEMLAVTPSPASIGWLVYEAPGELSALLRDIPVSATILSDPQLLSAAGSGHQLWQLLRKRFGKVTTSKLLAAKRPHLFPIKDRVVVEQLTGLTIDAVNNWWELWAHRFSASDAEHLYAASRAIRDGVESGGALSELRLLDIVIWMRGLGWRQASGSDAALLADFDAPLGEDS